MICYNSAGILFIASLCVVAASGYSYRSDVESHLLGRDMFYDYDYETRDELENAAAMKVDFGSCVAETYETQCQTAELDSDYPVHVCQTDGKT